jgi:tRNA (guanine37-N1)-methyltransferase
MILKIEPVVRALDSLPPPLGGQREVVLLTPQGEPCRQTLVRRLAETGDVVLLMGRYKGLDERIRAFATREVSLGDFILSGGELAALVLSDAMVRLVPGVLGDMESALSDSFEIGILDCGYYTRPVEYRGLEVPEVLRTGNHGEIEKYRRRDALSRTLRRRPDLLDNTRLAPDDLKWLRKQGWSGPPAEKAADLEEKGTGAGRSSASRTTTRKMRTRNDGRVEKR